MPAPDLDRHLGAEADELLDRIGRDRDAQLMGAPFLGDADLHLRGNPVPSGPPNPCAGWTQCRSEVLNLKRRIGRGWESIVQKKHSPAALAAAFRRQAGYCAELGSPLWAEAMGKVAADIEAGGHFARFLADWEGDLERGILPLRLFGGLHFLALGGEAPVLAAQSPLYAADAPTASSGPSSAEPSPRTSLCSDASSTIRPRPMRSAAPPSSSAASSRLRPGAACR